MAGCNLQDTEALSSIPIDQFDWLTCSINFLRFPSDGGGVQHWVPQLPLQCSRVLSPECDRNTPHGGVPPNHSFCHQHQTVPGGTHFLR